MTAAFTTITDGTHTVNLPGDLAWPDLYEWSKVRQILTQSCSGAVLVQANIRQAGKPVTLQTTQDNNGWVAVVSKATVDALRVFEDSPLSVLTLTFTDGRTFSVLLRYDADGPAIEATPLKLYDNPIDQDFYSLTLRLIQV